MELTVESLKDLDEKKVQAHRIAVTKANVEDYLAWHERLPTDITARILAIMERYDKKGKGGVAEQAIMALFAPAQQPTVRSMLARMRVERHMSYRQRSTARGMIRYWRMRSESSEKM